MLPSLHLQLCHRLIGHNLVDKLHVIGWLRLCGPLVLGLIRDKGQGDCGRSGDRNAGGCKDGRCSSL